MVVFMISNAYNAIDWALDSMLHFLPTPGGTSGADHLADPLGLNLSYQGSRLQKYILSF